MVVQLLPLANTESFNLSQLLILRALHNQLLLHMLTSQNLFPGKPIQDSYHFLFKLPLL